MHTKIGSGAHASTPIHDPRRHEKECTSRETKLRQGPKPRVNKPSVEPGWLGERGPRNVNIFAACKHACCISAAVIVVVEHFVQPAPKEDSATVAHRRLATAKGKHTHDTPAATISDTFPVEGRLRRVNRTLGNSNTCALPMHFCTPRHDGTSRAQRDGSDISQGLNASNSALNKHAWHIPFCAILF